MARAPSTAYRRGLKFSAKRPQTQQPVKLYSDKCFDKYHEEQKVFDKTGMNDIRME